MRFLSGLLLVVSILSFTACGDEKPSTEDLAAEAEAERIEAVTIDINTSVEAVENSADELIDALDSLDILFPETE
ncbi:MAG: hypothetical protein ACJAZ9_001527 [Neolewinella sp.]|jgi:hypothetical protein